MRKWMKATSVTALLAAGLVAFGAGTANAGHGHYDDDSINAVTSGNGSIAGGNQIIADVDVPINACGIAVGAALGLANAQCQDTVAYAD